MYASFVISLSMLSDSVNPRRPKVPSKSETCRRQAALPRICQFDGVG